MPAPAIRVRHPKPPGLKRLHHIPSVILLKTPEYGIEHTYVLSEQNVSTAMRKGKPVHYLPLYMAHLVAADAAPEREGIANPLASTIAPLQNCPRLSRGPCAEPRAWPGPVRRIAHLARNRGFSGVPVRGIAHLT